MGSQTIGSVKRMNRGRKVDAGTGDKSERPKLKLDRNHLMELKFGALLGESHQDTLAKGSSSTFLIFVNIFVSMFVNLCDKNAAFQNPVPNNPVMSMDISLRSGNEW